MTRRALKTTTASLLAISLIQPYPALAQFRAPMPEVMQQSSVKPGAERLFLAQAEAESEATSCFTDGEVDTERCDIDMLRAELEALLANGLPDAVDRPAEDELTAALSAEERIGLLSAAIEDAEREASAPADPSEGTVAADAGAAATDPAVQADAAAEAEAEARAAAEEAGEAQAEAEQTAQAEADAAAAAATEAANATAAEEEAAAQAEAEEAAAAAAAAEEAAAAEAARVAQAEAEAEAAVDAEVAANTTMEEQTENAVDDAAEAVSDVADEAMTEAERAAEEADTAAEATAETAETATDEAAEAASETITEAEETADAAAQTDTPPADEAATTEIEADTTAETDTPPAMDTDAATDATAAEAVADTATDTMEEAEANATTDTTTEAEATTDSAEVVETNPEAEPTDPAETVATAEEEAEASAMKDAEIVAEQEEAQGLAAVEAIVEGITGEATSGATSDSAAAGAEADADVTTEVVTEADTRSSSEEFTATARGTEAQSDNGGLSNLEKAGLFALGAVAVGAIIQNGQRVAATSGDRVIVEDNSGRYQVLKDDDALLRRPGATVETRRFDDGSTITLTTREDGSRVRTIRDASGRVLRRSVIGSDGQETVLINDIDRVEPVNVSTLPPAPTQRLSFRDARSTDELRAALREAELRDLDRTFSLRQVREIVEVRELAPQISIEDVTFRTGSAAIERSEAEQLRDIGLLMREMIRENPREVFLVEGYTDAVGGAASNLLLSDRRAESVALALTEYFDVPPENMVVQGYGERFLKVPTLDAERQNRRVAVRRVTNLIASR